MDDNYRIVDEKLIINDSCKKHVLYLNIAMVLVFLSSMITVIDSENSILDRWSATSIFIATSSLVLLFVNNYNKTTRSIIELEEIETISQKNKIHSKTYYVQLKNGKERYLPELKRKDIISKLQESIKTVNLKKRHD